MIQLVDVFKAFLPATVSLAAAACGSTSHDLNATTKSAECTVDADCAAIGPSAACKSGRCVAKGSQPGGASAPVCEIPSSADTSRGTDAGYAGCKPEPPCSGGLCSNVCPDSLYSLHCQSSAERPATDLGCSTTPIPGSNGDYVYCCRCANPTSDGTPLPSCTWPAELDKGKATGATCYPARAYVSCKLSSGVDDHCLSDKPTTCPGVGPFDPCMNECQPNEYAAACGGKPGPIPDPPAGCRAISPTPAGYAYYCCPCG